MSKNTTYMLFSLLFLLQCKEESIDVIPFDYDHFKESCDISSFINYNYDLLMYQGTKRATSDKKSGSCWDINKPKHNVWYTFKATSTKTISITILLDLNRPDSQKKTLLALWKNDGITELSCMKYMNEDDNVTLSYSNLIEGERYYFSVDVTDSESRGAFYLKIRDTF